MARTTAKENTKATEEIVKNEDAAGATEATEGEATEPEATAEAPKSEEKVTVIIPRFLFTGDTESTHHEVCVNGKIYQVKYDEPVEVSKVVAGAINDAIAQKKKVKALVNSLNGKAKEIAEE